MNGYLDLYTSIILLASASAISTPKVLSCTPNFVLPMPYPAPRIVVLPTNLSPELISSSALLYIADAMILYTSSFLSKASTRSCCPLNQATILASICEESASIKINPLGAIIESLRRDLRGKFCRLSLSSPPHRPV